ncbi:type I restriction enzyme S subunit [Clostridium beijerinckii]|uniref:restriction endonuclease subunit S n=1 Tax=Clostridium beijerinckii TaxID=1520 RepID=UPI0014941D21|nr:restriction endonuclease subunit S [Clostridium beijerinckii]NOW85896.1 type I restriction enzyme S subunit [Clostridium beijerinckii]
MDNEELRIDNELRPYDKYKDSGVEWIGNIPSHWKVVRNSILFREIVDTNHPELELLSIMCDKGIVKQSSTGRKIRMSEDNQTYKKICVGDIGYNLMNAFMGGIGASKYEGIISPAYAVCRPKVKINSWYYHYLFRTPLYKSEFNKNSYGIMYERNRLYFDRFKRILSIVPPIEEQVQIVKYLDSQIVKINKFIKAKKKLISVLKEQKQAVINEAVTKGINPNVKMKPSGIKWIGDIPEHWSVVRNKSVLKLRKDIVGDNSNKYTLLSLTTKGIIARDIESGKGKFPTDFNTYQVVNINDLIFCLFDMDETPRTVGLSDLHGMITGAYTVFSVNDTCREYVYYYYLALDQKKGLKPLYTGLRKIISKEVFLRAKLPYPPENEQLEIINYIKTKNEKINFAIDTIQQEIDLISEYCARLISDVVTGKVDVRHIEIDDIIEEDTDIDETEDEVAGMDEILDTDDE